MQREIKEENHPRLIARHAQIIGLSAILHTLWIEQRHCLPIGESNKISQGGNHKQPAPLVPREERAGNQANRQALLPPHERLDCGVNQVAAHQ